METVHPDFTAPTDLGALPCGFCRLRPDGPVALCRANGSFFALFGYTPGEAADAGFTSLAFAVTPADWPMARAALSDGLRAGGPFQFSFRAAHRSGLTRWVLLRLQPAGGGEFLDGAALDVTDEKSAPPSPPEDGGHADLLRRHLNLGRRLESACYRAIMELSGLLLMEADLETGVYYASPGADSFAFYPRLGRDGNHYMLTPELVHPEDWILAEALSQTVRRGAASSRACLRLLLTEGDYRRCYLAVNVLRDPGGSITRSLVTVLPADAVS